MKLLNKDILREYGFVDDATKSNVLIDVMTREGFDVLIKQAGFFFYSNLCIDYPLKDLTMLRRVFKQMKSKELTPIQNPS